MPWPHGLDSLSRKPLNPKPSGDDESGSDGFSDDELLRERLAQVFQHAPSIFEKQRNASGHVGG